MKCKWQLLVVCVIAMACRKVSVDKSFPNNYQFRNWIEFPVYVHTLTYQQNGIYNDRKRITKIPDGVIGSRRQADTLYLRRYFDTLNFERYSAVFSKPVFLNEFENVNKINPRFWLNFDHRFYYIRYGETITATSNPGDRDSVIFLAIVPKIPVDYTPVNGFEP